MEFIIQTSGAPHETRFFGIMQISSKAQRRVLHVRQAFCTLAARAPHMSCKQTAAKEGGREIEVIFFSRIFLQVKELFSLAPCECFFLSTFMFVPASIDSFLNSRSPN